MSKSGEALRALRAKGVVRVGAKGLQVVLGPQADQVAGEMREVLRGSSRAPGSAPRR